MPTLNTFPTKPTSQLKVPQVRVLVALMPDEGDEPPPGTMPRQLLAKTAGFIPTTGTINRVLHGIQNKNSTSGAAHPGLLELGLMEKVDIDLDGRTVDTYRITRAGIVAVRDWLSHNELPPKRDEESSTNLRYADDD